MTNAEQQMSRKISVTEDEVAVAYPKGWFSRGVAWDHLCRNPPKEYPKHKLKDGEVFNAWRKYHTNKYWCWRARLDAKPVMLPEKDKETTMEEDRTVVKDLVQPKFIIEVSVDKGLEEKVWEAMRTSEGRVYVFANEEGANHAAGMCYGGSVHRNRWRLAPFNKEAFEGQQLLELE